MFSASILIYWLRGDGPSRETQKEEGEEGEEGEEVACCFFARRRAAVRGLRHCPEGKIENLGPIRVR